MPRLEWLLSPSDRGVLDTNEALKVKLSTTSRRAILGGLLFIDVGSAVINHRSFWPVAAESVFAPPGAVRGLVADFGVAAFKVLPLGRGLGSFEGAIVGRKRFGPDVAQTIGVTTIMLAYVINNLHFTFS